MRRVVLVLLLLGLIASGCGGDAPEPEAADDRGISALEEIESETDEKALREGAAEKGGRNKKGRGTTPENSNEGAQTGARETSRSKEREVAADEGAAGGGSDTRTATPATAIPSGTYEYATDGRTTISGNSSALPDTTTLAAHAPSNGEQRQVRDLRDEDGNGTVTETRLLYRPDGAFLTYVKVTARFPGGLTDVREFRPAKPQLIAPTGGAPGFTRSFSMRGSGARADVTISALRYEKLKIDEASVRALVVDTKVEFSGSLEGKQDSVSWFWPKHLFVLKEEVHTDVRNGPIRLRSDYVALARRLP